MLLTLREVASKVYYISHAWVIVNSIGIDYRPDDYPMLWLEFVDVIFRRELFDNCMVRLYYPYMLELL